jgi:starch synthase (maltosyl-transferring)
VATKGDNDVVSMEKSPRTSRLGRIPIRFLSPQLPENLWSSKAFAGEVVPFAATVFREGHDQLGVRLILTDPLGATTTHVMRHGAPGSDRWHAEAQLTLEGEYRWHVRAFSDEWATWAHNAGIKIPAGIDVDLMLTMGAALLAKADVNEVVMRAAASFASTTLSPAQKLELAQGADLTEVMNTQPLADLETDSAELTIRVERARTGIGSWYEFFPRSEGAKRAKNGTWTSGTFRTAAKRIRAVAEMGFDVLYLPPIHPIGQSFRKGPNNTLVTAPGDPGSPWAIGSAEGGHDTVHPDLGTIKDFSYFLGVAKRNKVEVALDFALQCAPDHPWVTEHPEWFTALPDGTIAYAENPPKKYQDIYPVNFDNDPEGIRVEVLRLLRQWIALGVRIFRVDNPHTKPLQFWELVLGEINEEYPDVVFLAEAFTRPAMMQSLAQVGYQQSYSYFAWRNTKKELEQFFESISHETSAWFRPNLFVNTPDILTEFLQFGGRAAYKIRAVLAATASPSWGVYAGYELFEHVARPGSEENIDNEKYEYKQRDWAAIEKAGTSLAPYLTRLNLIRAAHPSLRQLRNLDVHWSDDESILVYTKFLDGTYAPEGNTDALIIVVNVDPHSVRETVVHLDLSRLGLDPTARFTVRDLLTGESFEWGSDNYVRLDAFNEPAHILHVEYPPNARS